jgi:HAMP domain-containing protein
MTDQKTREAAPLLSSLVERLRGIYRLGVNDGAGLLNGSDTFTRKFETPPIQHEAADAIEALEAEVGRLRAELEEAREVARTITRHWPHGKDNALDAALAQALCAIPAPSAALSPSPATQTGE